MDTSNSKNSLKIFFTERIPSFFLLIISFFKNSFEITSSKRSRIIGAVTAGVLMLLVILDYKAFVTQEYKQKWLLMSFCLVFPMVIGAVIAFNLKVNNVIIQKTAYFIIFFLMPIVIMTMTECLNRVFIYDMTHLGFIGNYLIILLFLFIMFAFTGSLRVAILSVNTVFFGLALAHAYIVSFRSTPFIPMDFFSITTAANVGSTYDYTPTDIIVTGTLLFIFITVFAIKLKTPKFKLLTRILTRSFMGAFFVVVFVIFYFTDIFAKAGIKPDFWNQTRGYRNYGFVYNFVCNTRYLFMSAPSGYDHTEISGLVQSLIDGDEEQQKPDTSNSPNIICIMNESLSDLSVLGDFETNEDYMPFMRSLTENTVKGNLYVPVIGAGTSNTEFEFLTGHSTAFLPSGSNAYMLYIKNPIASMVSTLENQGYSSLAFHPYIASGWNRPNVYNNMGFNSFKALENILDIALMDEYKNNNSKPDYLQQLIDEKYPDCSDMLLRQYVSDSYDYKLLIEDYENRDKSVPYYAFNVTMQNHGGYTTEASNFTETIYLTSTSKSYPKTNKYLSLVKESDKAFQELITHFQNVDEPTVICMFGDHQPSIEQKFIAEVLGVSDLSNLTLEQEQKRHVTPFFIWANYDIEEKYIDKLSVNYLSSYVLDIAGVQLTDYNKYLLKLSETLPVIDTVGYIDSENNYYRWSSESKYTKLLQEYEKIQYNNIFDYEHSSTDVFYLPGYSGENIAAENAKREKQNE